MSPNYQGHQTFSGHRPFTLFFKNSRAKSFLHISYCGCSTCFLLSSRNMKLLFYYLASELKFTFCLERIQNEKNVLSSFSLNGILRKTYCLIFFVIYCFPFPYFHCCHLFSFPYGRDDLNIEEKYVVRMSLYAPPLFHFCFPLLPSNLSSHLLTLLATSYMRCKELYGSNVPHLVIPHDRRSCKGLRRPNVPLRGYQHLSAYTPPEYIRAPPVQPSSAEPYRSAVQHHSELSHYNTAVSPSVTSLALCRLIQVVYLQNSRLLVSHFLPPRPGKGLPLPGSVPLQLVNVPVPYLRLQVIIFMSTPGSQV